MADGVNYCIVGGNLGDDPSLKVTSGGTSVLTMSVGCNSSYLDKNRVRQESVEWVRVIVFGKRAEGLAKFLRKGAKVFCEGALKTSSWEDRETGQRRYKTEVIASNVLLGGSNNPRKKQDDPERTRPNRRDHYDGDIPPDRSAPSQGGGGGGYDDQDYGNGEDDNIPFVCITRADHERWWRFG
jgi:single-strand DNA-binding protein